MINKKNISLGCPFFNLAKIKKHHIRNTYTLVPRRIGERDQVTVRILGLGPGRTGGGRFGRRLGRRGSRSWGWRRSRRSRCRLGDLLGVERTKQQLALVLLQNSLIVVFPELLGSILSGDTLEN